VSFGSFHDGLDEADEQMNQQFMARHPKQYGKAS
jgi:hypothetical protein